MNALTHVDGEGRLSMVDVGGKPIQVRVARASGRITLAAHTLELIRGALVKKGDVLAAAQIAGIQAPNRPHT